MLQKVVGMLQESGPISDDKRRKMNELLRENGLDALGNNALEGGREYVALSLFSVLYSVSS